MNSCKRAKFYTGLQLTSGNKQNCTRVLSFVGLLKEDARPRRRSVEDGSVGDDTIKKNINHASLLVSTLGGDWKRTNNTEKL